MDRIDIVAQRKSIERILERNGEVTLMFYVKAPKVLLDSCWKLTMYPELIEKRLFCFAVSCYSAGKRIYPYTGKPV